MVRFAREEKKENRFAEILRLQQLPLRMTEGTEELRFALREYSGQAPVLRLRSG